MKNEDLLTPERLDEMVRRHLVVRARLERLPPMPGRKHGQLVVSIALLSFFRDMEERERFFETRVTYHDPCRDRRHIPVIEIRELVHGKEDFHSLLSAWSRDFPSSGRAQVALASVKADGKNDTISCHELHLLQNLARLHASILGMVKGEDPSQYHLWELSLSLASFLEHQNREAIKYPRLLIQKLIVD